MVGLAALGWLVAAAAIVMGIMFFWGGPSPQAGGTGSEQVIGGPDAATDPGGETERASRPAAGAQSVVFTQEQVNTQVTYTLQQQGASVPVRDVRVTLLEDNRVRATGQAALPGQGELPLTVDLRLSSTQGQLSIDITDARSGMFPLPPSVVESVVQETLQGTAYRDLSNIRLPQDIESVQVEQGRLIIKRKP